MHIAFLGLGKMGRLMAGHLISDGHSLSVWNRSKGKAGELVARGAREHATPREAVQGADAVVLMLFDASAVRSVLFEGTGAAVEGLKRHDLVIDASTTGPTEAVAIAKELAERGIRYVDAPVTGSTPVAEQRKLGVLLGGPKEDTEAATAVVRSWADREKLRRVGDTGQGQAMKVVMNLSLGLAISGVGECLALAERLDLNRAEVLDVLGGGPFGFTLGQKAELIKTRNFETPTFTVDALAKDLRLAEALGAGGPATTGALAAADRAQAEQRGDQDYSAMAVTVQTAEERGPRRLADDR